MTESSNPKTASSATEESGSVALTASALAEAKERPRAFLQSGRRNLREEEMDSPGVRRFMIAEIERLDQICAELESFRNQYNDQRVELAILKEGAKTSLLREILTTFCISVGFAGLGAAPNYLKVAGAENLVWFVIGLSVVLIIGGLVTKAWK